jgi:hypothetical protein
MHGAFMYKGGRIPWGGKKLSEIRDDLSMVTKQYLYGGCISLGQREKLGQK